MKLILGSGSKTKKIEFEKAGFVFETMSADIDEKAIRHDDHYMTPLLVARGKMDALKPQITEEVCVIAADTVVVCGERIIEKPTSREELFEFARLFENNHVDVVTGLIIWNSKTGKCVEGRDICKVEWGTIDDAQLAEIADEGSVFQAAGFNQLMVDAFALSHDSMDRLRGMPIDLVKKLLAEVASE